MPVTLLFCEGKTDARLLNSILADMPILILPFGGKYGLGERVKAQRLAQDSKEVAALRDRDFPVTVDRPLGKLVKWEVSENNKIIQLGWYWERRELENYLLDPIVVQKALGDLAPEINEYNDALKKAANEVSIYTAARIALTVCRPRFSPISSSWGRAHGRYEHKFPDVLTDEACREGISKAVNEYNQVAQIDLNDALQKFESFKIECRTGGIRNSDHLTFFAGKDLLIALEPSLRIWRFKSGGEFIERINKGIEKSQNISDWLPEWKDLRESVQNWTGNAQTY